MSVDLSGLENYLNDAVKHDAETAVRVGTLEADKAVKENFEKQGAGTPGGAWQKKKKPDGRNTLTGKSGALMNSAGAVEDMPNLSINLVSNTPYDEIHNTGGTIHMPARTMKFKEKEITLKNGTTKKVSRFAKNSRKRGVESKDIEAYDITIPKREFLVLNTEQIERMENNIEEAISLNHQ